MAEEEKAQDSIEEKPAEKPKEEASKEEKPAEASKEEKKSEKAPRDKRGREKGSKKKGVADQAISSFASPAEVVELIGRVGGKHASMQVRCKVLDGRDSGRIIRRNVIGPVRIGDILMLTQTEIEASPLKGGRR